MFSKTMPRATLPLLPLIIFFLRFATTAESAAAPTNFIKASCKATTYPALCTKTLTPYAGTIQQSPCRMAQTALLVSLARAQSTNAFVTTLSKIKGLKAREYKAIDVCLDQMNDSVERIGRSIKELKHAGKAQGKDLAWAISNVQTWVSAAITDGTTCLDGFAGRALNGAIKASITARVTNVIQLTSNALALVNKFAENI